MSPSQYHEMYTSLLHDLGRITADEIGCDFESRGSATFKKKSFPGGMEPDTCFFIQNATRIIGKRKLDPHRDPPPDVIVEIDISSGSLYKLDFYADLGAPEIWRYDGSLVEIYLLSGDDYVGARASLAFPFLSCEVLARFLVKSKTDGQDETLRAFSDWVEQNSATE